MAEYASAYGGPPAPDSRWRLFVTLCEKTARFGARTQLAFTDGVNLGISLSFGKGSDAKRARDAVVRAAYPLARKGEKVFINRHNLPKDDAEVEATDG